MDWDFAIERHRGPLLRIVAALFAMIGLTEGGAIERLSRPLYRHRARRIAAGGISGAAIDHRRGARHCGGAFAQASGTGGPKISAKDKAKSMAKPKPKPKAKTTRRVLSSCSIRPSVSMKFIGRRHKTPSGEPRIHVFDFDPRIPEFLRSQFSAPAPAPAAPALEKDDAIDDDTVNAGPLCRRLAAIKYALEDIPRQAKRLARWWARPVEERRPQLSNHLSASVGRRDSASGKSMRSTRS